MTEQEALHIVRNPYGHSEQEVRFARLTVADALEALLERPMQRPAILGLWIERGVNQMRALAPNAESDPKWLLGWLLANSNISAKRADEIMEMFEPIVYDDGFMGTCDPED